MKLSIFIVAAVSTAVLAAEEHLDVRSCVCSSTASSCHCKDAEKSVQVFPDAVPKCVASRGWKAGDDAPYPNNSCGLAQRYADIACIVSRAKPMDPFPGDWCGGSQRRADIECSPSKRSAEDASEAHRADACAAAQKRAIACIVSRSPEDPFPGDWCGGTIDAVEENCNTPATRQKRTDVYPGDWCGRRRKDCITARAPEEPFPGDWCGGSLRLARDCIVSRSPEGDFPGDWCGKREEHCRVSRNAWCEGVQKRADNCIVSRGWKGYPWDVCNSSDAECTAAAKRELGYDMDVKRELEAADACDYSSRSGRRAVNPPHCMCPVKRDGAGADAVKRCRCGEETREVATKYHCMCLTGEGDETAPCACNSDVAFLSEVQYEQ